MHFFEWNRMVHHLVIIIKLVVTIDNFIIHYDISIIIHLYNYKYKLFISCYCHSFFNPQVINCRVTEDYCNFILCQRCCTITLFNKIQFIFPTPFVFSQTGIPSDIISFAQTETYTYYIVCANMMYFQPVLNTKHAYSFYLFRSGNILPLSCHINDTTNDQVHLFSCKVHKLMHFFEWNRMVHHLVIIIKLVVTIDNYMIWYDINIIIHLYILQISTIYQWLLSQYRIGC